MKLNECFTKEQLSDYADVEFYIGLHGNHCQFHTDKVDCIDGDFDSLKDREVLTYEAMDEDEYNATIYANCGMKADFDEWFDDKNAKILCILLADKEDN